MPTEVPIERLIDELSQSPQIIGGALSTLGNRAALNGSDGEWSPRQIVEHLTALQIVWSDLMHAAYESGALPNREAHWMQIVDEFQLNRVPLKKLMDRFSSDRAKLVAFLGSLSETELMHEYEFRLKNGKPTSRSIDGIAQRLLRHEQQHIRVLLKAIATS